MRSLMIVHYRLSHRNLSIINRLRLPLINRGLPAATSSAADHSRGEISLDSCPFAPPWFETRPEIGFHIDTENCCTIQVQRWTGVRDEVHFEPLYLVVRNLDPRSAAIALIGKRRRGRGGVVVRLLASRLSEPGSIPGGVAPRFSHVGNCAKRCRWSAGFLEDLPFPPPLHSGAAPYCSLYRGVLIPRKSGVSKVVNKSAGGPRRVESTAVGDCTNEFVLCCFADFRGAREPQRAKMLACSWHRPTALYRERISIFPGKRGRATPKYLFVSEEIWAALNIEFLRADEGEVGRICGSAGMKGWWLRDIPEKTCGPAGNRTRSRPAGDFTVTRACAGKSATARPRNNDLRSDISCPLEVPALARISPPGATYSITRYDMVSYYQQSQGNFAD
ncbi:hypothetical protein PR048_031342 [Dryococelus australis]|uniref:Uncharacterized protein n=1 Tax=Dryococelus australis TaxID=614101 RepID=A0ABQ9G4Z7_9NEOP|nr:hypothetical protein PR048_031342 [Dryococelus australis]